MLTSVNTTSTRISAMRTANRLIAATRLDDTIAASTQIVSGGHADQHLVIDDKHSGGGVGLISMLPAEHIVNPAQVGGPPIGIICLT